MANNMMQWLQTQLNNMLFLHPFTTLSFLFFLFFIYKFFIIINQSNKNHLPPSPPKLPIIGNLHQIGQLPHRSFHNLSKQHGNLMLLYFGRNPVLVVSYAEGASYITKTHDIIFADRPALGTFKRLLYDCKDVAMAPYGDYWRRVRSICVNQLLSYKRVQSFSSVREEEIGQMIEEIRRLSIYDSRRVNLSKLFSNFTSDVICRVAFGMKFNGEKDGINFKDLLEKHEELLGRFNVGDFMPWLSWINHVNGVENEIKKTNRDMDKVLEDMVEVHLDKMRKNQGTNNNEETTQDFIDVLLELQKDEIAEMSVNKKSIKAIIVVCSEHPQFLPFLKPLF
ncbi:Cytochrome P450 71A26 [Bienertia sinuspersici]